MREPIKLFSFILLALCFFGCQNKKKGINEIKNTAKEYNYSREFIKYDLGNNITEDLEIYINKNNDTLSFQKIIYNRNIIDSSKSRFYKLNLNRDEKLNILNGKLTYCYDSIKDGKLVDFTFSAVSKQNDKTKIVDFKNFDSKRKFLEFSFGNNNDTLIGAIFAQHAKDTIENGEKKVRIREILLPVDNYSKTNNPFVEIKL
ncbi:hypothetical protein [Gaetbulibacter aestuarii]|uniref:Lipoprotein n=1 Tax=Gaetbulibacter aestuarii TaxID=1502358 RepID=A0ABW7MU84_9FLAO